MVCRLGLAWKLNVEPSQHRYHLQYRSLLYPDQKISIWRIMKNRLYVVEFQWQLEAAIEAARLNGVLVVAANPMMAYALERAGVPFITIADAYEHSEFWALYSKTVKIADRLTENLDLALTAVDPRFGVHSIEPYKYLRYVLKVNLDQIICYLFQIHRLIKKYNVNKIYVAESSKLAFSNQGLFVHECSVIGHVLGTPQVQEVLGVEVLYIKAPGIRKQDTHEVSQKLDRRLLVQGKTFLRHIKRGVNTALSKMRAGWLSCNVLAVNSKEIITVAQSLASHKVCITPLNEISEPLNSGPPYDQVAALLAQMRKMEGASDIYFDEVTLQPFIEDMIPPLSRSLEPMLKVYHRMERKLSSGRFDLVVVQTLTPFDFLSIMAHRVAQQKGIELVCWMHGGYGAYYSLFSYAMSDFRFGKNHILYGPAVKDVIESEHSVLRYDGANPQYNCCVGGSPYFMKQYAGYERPRNERKTVVLTISGAFNYNQFYFGYDRPNAEFWNWHAQRRLIEALSRFSDQYRIIIKDYPRSVMRDTWEALVESLGARMEVITTEQPYEDVVMGADVLIYSWVSTSFIEGLLTDADILLYDDSGMSDQSIKLFEDHIVFDQHLERFIYKMCSYLNDGEFYCQNHAPLKSYFCPDVEQKNIADYFTRLGVTKGAEL